MSTSLRPQKNVSLKTYNTFGFDVMAESLLSVSTERELQEFAKNPDLTNDLSLVLGGGSNLCLTSDIKGLVLQNQIMGKAVVSENDEEITLRFGAGENWHQTVMWTLDQGYFGLENLSLIPGNIGTAPMQNIGAYGVEIKDLFHSLEAVELGSGKVRTFTAEDCEFGYRESVFKKALKGKYIIASVCFTLKKKNHTVKTAYGDIQKVLQDRGIKNPTPKEVSDAVITIRQSKLPDPAEIGNSGSFFKNPIISAEAYEAVKSKHPEIVAYPTGDDYKVSAGWMIDRAGWKGHTEGHVGVHKKQALVLVHYGEGKGSEIVDLAHKIIEDIYEKYGVRLEPEVNIL